MPALELIGATPSNHVRVCHIALPEKGVSDTKPDWIPGRAASAHAA